MITLKTQQEIGLMREGGKRLGQVLQAVLGEVRPGVSEAYLDKVAETEIKKQGGFPSFKMVPGYHWATCITPNDQVVHGIPGKTKLKNGDLVGIDVGMFFKGFHTDLATTVIVGTKNEEQEEFLEGGKRALKAAIGKAQVGNFVGDLSLTIQEEIEDAGFSPVETLTGHGVGKRLHEEPSIPCVLKGKREKTIKIEAGMTFAIEVIYNQGSKRIVLEEDSWTISTWDGKISGLFEETVAVSEGGPLVLTSNASRYN